MVLTANEIILRGADGTEISAQPLDDDPGAMVAYLDNAFGEDATPDASPSCETYSWGTENAPFILAVSSNDSDPTSTFNVRVKSRSVERLSIETESGYAIGDDLTDVVSGLAKDRELPDGGGLLDGVRPGPFSSFPVGAVVYTDENDAPYLVLTPGLGGSGEECDDAE